MLLFHHAECVFIFYQAISCIVSDEPNKRTGLLKLVQVKEILTLGNQVQGTIL